MGSSPSKPEKHDHPRTSPKPQSKSIIPRNNTKRNIARCDADTHEQTTSRPIKTQKNWESKGGTKLSKRRRAMPKVKTANSSPGEKQNHPTTVSNRVKKMETLESQTSGKKNTAKPLPMRAKEKHTEDDHGDCKTDEEVGGLTSKEEIENYLRKSRVPETKVRNLSVMIVEQSRKQKLKQQQKQMRVDTSTARTALQNVISQPLDLMLYGRTNKTSLKNIDSNLEELVDKLSDMVQLLRTDMVLCFDSAEKYIKDNSGSKSMPLMVLEALMTLQTDNDILKDKFEQLNKEKEETVLEQTKVKHRSDALEETSVQAEMERRKLVDQNKEVSEHVLELKAQQSQLKHSAHQLEEDNARLRKQLELSQEGMASANKDIIKLQKTCIQLQLHNEEWVKEIRRLKDPDKEMVFKIQQLQTELRESKTTNRKLELEKGTIRATLTKLQAQCDNLQKERNQLITQNQKLRKENEKVNITNKKLKLSS